MTDTENTLTQTVAGALPPAKTAKYMPANQTSAMTAAVRLAAFHKQPVWLYPTAYGWRIVFSDPTKPSRAGVLPKSHPYIKIEAEYDPALKTYQVTQTMNNA